METKKTLNSQSVFRKKNGTWGISLPDFGLYYKATVIKTVWYWHKNRNIDQWNKIENQAISPCTHGYLIFDQGGKKIQWGKDSLFNKWCWENCTATCKKSEIRSFLNLTQKISSKWIKNLNVGPDTIKLIEENICKTLSDINHSNIFLNPSPRIMEIKTKINKWYLLKLKRFCTAKETVNK